MATYTLPGSGTSVFDLQPSGEVEVSGYTSLFYAPDPSNSSWDLSSAAVFNVIPEGGGGGDTRPTSGMLYPRGQG